MELRRDVCDSGGEKILALCSLPRIVARVVFAFLSASAAALVATCSALSHRAFLWHILDARSRKVQQRRCPTLRFCRARCVSSADSAPSFWLPVAPRHEKFDGKCTPLAYRRAIQRRWRCTGTQEHRTGRRNLSDWYSLLAPARRMQVSPHRRQAMGPFGVTPVILVASYMGGDYLRMAAHNGVSTVPLNHRYAARMRTSTVASTPVPAFPGWEQRTGRADPNSMVGEVELLCFAFGGSDPPNRWWHFQAQTSPHARATLANVVGIIYCTSNHLHMEIGGFERKVLWPLHDILGRRRTERLPVALVCGRTKNAGLEPRQFLWRLDRGDGEDPLQLSARIFYRNAGAMEWVYRARAWRVAAIEEGEEDEEPRDPLEDPEKVRRNCVVS